MRSILVILAAMLSASVALAEPSKRQKPMSATTPGKQLPLKGAASSNSCAAYGAGFVRVEGSDTCVKVGGAVSVGGGMSAGSR